MARSTLIGIVVAALAAGAWWWNAAAPGAPAASVSGPSRAHHPGTPASPPLRASADATAVSAAPAGTPPAAGSPPPPGLTPAQWALVLADLQGRPDAAAERQRLEAYFGWSDTVRRWREQRDDATLAAEVDAGLPDRLARREVSAGEGRQLKAALLLTLEPDPDRRNLALQAFDAQLPASAGPDPRQRAFEQQQAALVAAWQTRPAASRDPQALARELAALRRQHFASSATPSDLSPVPTSGR